MTITLTGVMFDTRTGGRKNSIKSEGKEGQRERVCVCVSSEEKIAVY